MKSLLFWLVFPFLVPQALYVRQTAPRFAPASGPTEGLVGQGQIKRLLALGDSIIAGVGASELHRALVGRTAASLAETEGCQVEWHALGRSGYDAREILEDLVPKLPDQDFDFIIISVGVNDITGLTRIRNWRRTLEEILSRLRKHSPDAVIAVAGMPPMHGFPLLPQPLRALFGMRARLFDETAREVVSEFGKATHLPVDFEPHPERFSPDGYHPSEESYVEFGARMADALVSINRTA